MNPDEVWKTVKDDLHVELSGGTFNAFVAQTQLSTLSDAGDHMAATLAAMSPWHQRMLEERLRVQIQEAFERVLGKPCQLSFVTDDTIRPAPVAASLGPLFAQADADRVSYHRAVQLAHLRPDFTFEQLAVSSTNEMAYAAAQAVSRSPGQAYHLLFLFGGVGVGKTHLMQAIGHRILEKDPEVRVIYCSGETFTNEIIEAIRDRSTAEFRKKYRSVKILMIDDIQFIGGKDKVQEEFFHTFNAIHQEGGQIILTSDKLPQDIVGLEDRLRSRFEGGLTVDIQQPSFELRSAILLIKAKILEMELPMDVAQLAAANIHSTRFLEGFLRRMMAESEAKREPITLEMAQRILKSMGSLAGNDATAPERTVSSSAKSVITVVADTFSLKVSQLTGKQRKKELVLPRHLAMYIMRTELNVPLMEIGRLFGGRDHTTVMHATERVTHELVTNSHLRDALVQVQKRLVA